MKATQKNETTVQQVSNLKLIYDTLKPLLKVYEKFFNARMDFDSRYELWSEKEVVIEGRKRKDLFFASLIIQSNYVGFYFMPVYAEKELKKIFKPKLLGLLKGKSCFHIKSVDAELVKQIEEALEQGYARYKQNGYV